VPKFNQHSYYVSFLLGTSLVETIGVAEVVLGKDEVEEVLEISGKRLVQSIL